MGDIADVLSLLEHLKGNDRTPTVCHTCACAQAQVYIVEKADTVVSVFETFDKIVYNSASSSAATAANGAQSDIPPSGANWATLGYDNEVAAVRALRKRSALLTGS